MSIRHRQLKRRRRKQLTIVIRIDATALLEYLHKLEAELWAKIDDLIPKIPEGHYQCSMCGGIFKLNTDPEYLKQAEAEWHRDFDPSPDEHRSIVCDDCYEKIRPDTHPKEYAEYKAEMN